MSFLPLKAKIALIKMSESSLVDSITKLLQDPEQLVFDGEEEEVLSKIAWQNLRRLRSAEIGTLTYTQISRFLINIIEIWKYLELNRSKITRKAYSLLIYIRRVAFPLSYSILLSARDISDKSEILSQIYQEDELLKDLIGNTPNHWTHLESQNIKIWMLTRIQIYVTVCKSWPRLARGTIIDPNLIILTAKLILETDMKIHDFDYALPDP